MNKYYLYFLVLCCLGCDKKQGESSRQKTATYKLEVFQADHHSYGYEILKGQESIIRQETIPGLAQQEGFRSPKDARKVGELMLRKLEQGHFPPSVSKREVDSLQIRY